MEPIKFEVEFKAPYSRYEVGFARTAEAKRAYDAAETTKDKVVEAVKVAFQAVVDAFTYVAKTVANAFINLANQAYKLKVGYQVNKQISRKAEVLPQIEAAAKARDARAKKYESVEGVRELFERADAFKADKDSGVSGVEELFDRADADYLAKEEPKQKEEAFRQAFVELASVVETIEKKDHVDGVRQLFNRADAESLEKEELRQKEEPVSVPPTKNAFVRAKDATVQYTSDFAGAVTRASSTLWAGTKNAVNSVVDNIYPKIEA
jgi:hypothetical protein